MKTLIMVNTDGVMFGYNLEAIQEITFPIAGTVYNASDLKGNGIRATDTVIRIKFYDGAESTFNAKCWGMRFE